MRSPALGFRRRACEKVTIQPVGKLTGRPFLSRRLDRRVPLYADQVIRIGLLCEDKETHGGIDVALTALLIDTRLRAENA